MSEQSQSLASNASQELGIKPSISTLAQGSMFWQPEYKEPSSWLEHLPFLFWLVEALRPSQTAVLGVELVPHFALCQAITRLRLGGHCYAIGEASDQQRASLEAYGSENFAGTSLWINTNPKRAIQQFGEATIDLLLLNVPADDDSIDYLLDRWTSKLSPQAVVLLPGISKREPGCQAFRVFEELKSQYPRFGFYHAGGLGVVMVGDTPPALLQNLLATLESNASQQVVHDIFGRLGRSCQDKVIAQQHQQLANTLQTQMKELTQDLAAARTMIEEQEGQLKKQKKQSADLQSRITDQDEHFTHEKSKLEARLGSLELFNSELKKELMRRHRQTEECERLNQQYEETQALQEKERDQIQRKNEQLKNEYDEQQAELSKLRELLESRDNAIRTLTEERSLAKNTCVELNEKIQQLEQQQETSKHDAQRHAEEVAALITRLEESDQTFNEKDRQIALQTQRLEEQETSLNERFEELGQLTRQLRDAETSGQNAQRELADVKSQNETLSQQVKALGQREQQAQQQIDERFQEIAVLTNLLEEREAQQNQSNEQIAQLKHELQAAQKASQQLEVSKNEQKAHLENRLLEAQKAKQQLEVSRNEQQAQLENRLLEAQKAKQHSEARISELTRALDQANKENQRQSNELATLIERLESYRQPASANELIQEDGPASSASTVRKTPPLTKRAMKRQVAMIENSRLFDATWYLNQYPDIANDPKMAKQPSRHYLVMGGFEGRNPGPEFDSAYYLAAYPDVAEGGTNPLIHYLKFGVNEQRSIKASE
ncbi:hypothetical protein ACGK9R_16720 [Halomonas sp. HNIBRBA4712]|uniref:hypothetical protein n=1 Tax=Halomonas sp. HNIBRBA4712 TaxID=3373087 RepID=UPI0037470A32